MCGETKGLKAITCTGIDCDFGKYHPSSVCKSCYFDTCSCEEDSHTAGECLQEKDCPNHQESLDRFKNWDKLNYSYQPINRNVEKE